MTYDKADRRNITVNLEARLVSKARINRSIAIILFVRFGLVQQMKTLDEGLAEAISSIIWVTPRLQADVAELKIVSEQLAAKVFLSFKTISTWHE